MPVSAGEYLYFSVNSDGDHIVGLAGRNSDFPKITSLKVISLYRDPDCGIRWGFV